MFRKDGPSQMFCLYGYTDNTFFITTSPNGAGGFFASLKALSRCNFAVTQVKFSINSSQDIYEAVDAG